MINIRHLTDKDKESFNELFKIIIQENFPEYSKNIKRYLVAPKYRNRMFKLPTKLGAFDKTRLVGFLLGDKGEGGVMFIWWIAVSKAYQRKGIGTKFLTRIEKLSLKRGIHSIRLEADNANILFYKQKGYEIIGLDKKGYFGTDNYVLKKLIQEPKDKNFLK